MPTKQECARCALYVINDCGGPLPAAHHFRVTLESIRPYTDRGTSWALALAEWVGMADGYPERVHRRMVALARDAGVLPLIGADEWTETVRAQ